MHDEQGREQAPRRGTRILAPRAQAEVDEELAFHLEQRIRENVARGMGPDEARRAALERLGDVNDVRRECAALLQEDRRATARRAWLDDLAQDVRFGVRGALRTPLFSLLAVVTLALGIGANAAVFGVVKSVLLDALPYRDADRVVRLYARFEDGSSERGPLSAGTVHDFMQRQRSFEGVAFFHSMPDDVVYGGDGGPVATTRTWMDPELLRVLGVRMALGRPLAPDDVRDTTHSILVSHGAWQRLFGGDSAILGREVRVNHIPRAVVGVLPRDFVGPGGEADFYFPTTLAHTLRDPVSARGSHFYGMVARLKPGVTPEMAGREAAAIGRALAQEHPRDNANIVLYTMSIRDALMGDTRTPLLVLMASAGLVLLITCANLAGALLSRTLSRRKEFAVRVAMGAGRGRLVRQLLTESTLLAVAGGAAGLLLAALGLAVLRRLALPSLPAYAELALDPGAVAVTGLVAVLTGVAFGVAPALAAGRANVQGTLREETRGASETRHTRSLRGLLVAGQIALCVSLLAGAGLLARSLWAMTTAPLGFDPNGVLAVSLQIPAGRYRTVESLFAFQQQFAERLRAIPGVRDVAQTLGAPTTLTGRMGIAVEGAPDVGNNIPFTLWASVTDDYFRTLRVPLRRGRLLDARDHADAPPTAVVSEAFARQLWPGAEAIGKRFRAGPGPNSTPITVVGIVGDVRNDPARVDAEAMYYRSERQFTTGAPTVLIRVDGDPLSIVPTVRRELAALEPGVPLERAVALPALLSEGLAGRRLPVVLMTAFGALALLLASVGVYAMFAAMGAAREREFGVRVALGSSRGAIAGLVLRQGALWMAVGLAGGAVGVVWVSRVVRELLFGVAPFDPVVLGGAVAVLVACAALALLVPIRRATRVDPITVLR